MATPYRISVSERDTGLLKFNQSADIADRASALLQKDLEKHHVFFNASGFHNHIPHHVLALFGTGAGVDALEKGWEGNDYYQRDVMEPDGKAVAELDNWDAAQKYLGKEGHYSTFLLFFQKEIERLGWQEVLKEYLFKGDERSDDMFQRMFAGFLHPLIQLMYGMEWEQPAIIAQGLAQAAVHINKPQMKDFFVAAEKGAADTKEPMPSILSLLEEVGKDEKLAKSARFDDDNKIYDGVLVRAPEEALKHVSKVKVAPEELDERTAEMFHTALYMAACASFHHGKEPKFDFFLMHHVNAAPIFLTINSLPWIPTEAKVRILEYKIRMDLVQYAARGCPPLPFDELASYKPKDKNPVSKPRDLLPRLHKIPDDGHTIKLSRAALICQDACKEYEGADWAKIKGDDLWLKVNYLILDSTENVGQAGRYVRSAGFDEAWKDMPNRL